MYYYTKRTGRLDKVFTLSQSMPFISKHD